ncbi:hypothetical protein [Cyclobacterium marinum]
MGFFFNFSHGMTVFADWMLLFGASNRGELEDRLCIPDPSLES